MKFKLLLIYPWIIIALGLQSLFVKITFTDPAFDPIQILFNEELTLKNDIWFTEGLLNRIQILNQMNQTLTEDKFVPVDARLEKMEDKMERILLFLKITAIFIIFLIVLAFSTFLSLRMKAWYTVFINRAFYLLSFLFLFQNLSEKTLAVRSPAIGIALLTIYLPLIILCIYNFFAIGKLLDVSSLTFISLKRKLMVHEDDESLSEKVAIKSSANIVLKTFFHFSIIIIAGILIGNLLYIPVFTVQKLFKAEFGFILLVILLLLSAFYIAKYYEAGHESRFNKKENLLAGMVFLQYRFLKNTLSILLSIFGVILFFTLLISILTLNTGILTDVLGIIEKSTEL